MFADYTEFLIGEDYPISQVLRDPATEVDNFANQKDKISLTYARSVGSVYRGPTMIAKPQRFYTEKELLTFSGSSDVSIKEPRHYNSKGFKNKYSFRYIEDGYGTERYLYYDEYKGRSRLNIALHGNFIDNTGVVEIDGAFYDYTKIIDVAHEAELNKDFDCLRLLTCHSAEGGNRSLISRVSHELCRPVKGYIGEVRGRPWFHMAIESGDVRAINESLGRARDVGYVDSTLGYARYVRHGKTVMAGFEYF